VSIEKNIGGFGYMLICDQCGESEDFDEFSDAVAGKKDLGWKSCKIDGDWNDICQDCQFK